MNRQIRLIALFAFAGLSALSQAQTPAPAAASTPRVDQREANQQARIAQGAASGTLTARETKRLEKEQAAINKAEDKAKADGTVTKHERRRLHTMQDAASKDIHHAKHNAKPASATGQ